MKRTSWSAVAAAIGAGVVAAFYVAKLPAALPELKRELSLSLVGASAAVSAFNTLAVVAAPLFGLAADRIGAFAFVLAGLALLAAGALTALTGGETMLLASRVIEGTGFLATVIGAPALISAATESRDRKTALGVWSAYMPLGASLTMVGAPFVIAAAGWRGLWLAAAASTVLVAVWLVALRRQYPTVRPQSDRGLRPALEPLVRPGPRWLGLAFAFYTAQFTSVMVWLPTFLVANGTSLAAATLSTAGYVAVNVPGNLLGTWLVQRGTARASIVIGVSICMGLAALLAFAPVADALRYGALLLLSLVGGMIPAAVLSGSTVFARSSGELGSIQGIIVQGANLGQFVGPPAVAALVAWRGDWAAALVVLEVMAALGVVAGLRLARHECTVPVGSRPDLR